MSKTFVVGDIHGCYEEIKELLEKINLNRSSDTIIFVGDYFDRGPKSYEVWLLLKTLREEMGERCILLKGNHEQMMVEYLNHTDSCWSRNGYETTIQSFFKENGVPLYEVKKWIEKETVPYYEGKWFDVVHAGREYEEDLSKEDSDTLIWDRSLLRGRKYSGKLTFLGHTPLTSGPIYLNAAVIKGLEYDVTEELPDTGIIAIDTACVYGNKLTAAEVTDDFQLRMYYIESRMEED